MLIQTEPTADPKVLRFLPGTEVVRRAPIEFANAEDAQKSSFVEMLFQIPGIIHVTLNLDSIDVTSDGTSWTELKPPILNAIMDHYLSGAPMLRSPGQSAISIDGIKTSGDPIMVQHIRDALRQVIDPELGYNIVDIGLIYGIDVDRLGGVHVTMTTTTPGCPAMNYLRSGAGEAASSVAGVEVVDVEMTHDPAWTPDMMSPAAKSHFGIR